MKTLSLMSQRARLGVRGFFIIAALVLGCGLLQGDPARWTKNIDAFTAADQASPPAKGGIVFTGSSTISIWNRNLSRDFPGYNVIGRGFGGSTIEDGVFYADRTVLPHAPRMVVFYAGENDIAGKKTPERVAEDFAKFCDIVLKALPETRILYVSMKPSPRRWALQAKMDEANALIAAYCSRTYRTAFLDMKPLMIGPDGQPRAEYFKDDKLHLNDEGYRVWREAIAPLLAPESITVPVLEASSAAASTVEATVPSFATDADILIDFGDAKRTTASTGELAWNNVHTGNQNAAAGHALVDVRNAPSGITLRVTKPFSGANNGGVTSGNRYPVSASGDSLFGNTEEFSKKSSIFPELTFSGLNPTQKYIFTFFGSRGGSKDNRTTRYTISGGTEVVVELDAANNKDATVRSAPVASKADGSLVIAIGPGDANNNANHFTYLGVLEIKVAGGESTVVQASAAAAVPATSVSSAAGEASVLIDFGDARRTTPSSGDTAWNNIHMGNQNASTGHALVDAQNAASGITLRVTKPFGGANSGGVTSGNRYPASASGDSLFGNTEEFSKKSNVFPELTFSDLNPDRKYVFTFFASRGGSKDNRTTRYTISGGTEAVAELDAANNKEATVSSVPVAPKADGTLVIGIGPGDANNNANHFTYLGVLEVKVTN